MGTPGAAVLTGGANIRVGLIGAGAAGELHAAAITTTAGLELSAVATSSPDRARVFGDRWKAPATSVDTLIADSDIDAVFVTSPTATHIPFALRALEHGKHVFVEKPVAATSDEIRELDAAAARAGLQAIPGHNYLYQPECERLVRQVRGGTLGRIRSLHVDYAIRHPESLAAHYDGVLHEVMVHHAYIALAALGKPDRVVGGVTTNHWETLATDDQAWMVWEYDDGALAMLYATFAVDDFGPDPMTFAVKALGESGTSSYSWRSTTTREQPFTFGIPLYAETYQYQAAAFRDVLLGTREPASTLHDAALIADIVDAVSRSANQAHPKGNR